MIDTIIFDLGGVLIKWDPKNLFRKIFTDEKEMQYFLDNVCTMHWNEQQDAGRTWKDATEFLTPQFPKYEKEILAYSQRWEEMLAGPLEGTVHILKKLIDSKKYQIVALTNWSAETFPIALERYDFLQWFEGILVSGVENMKKPDPRIYQLLLERYNIQANRSVFIDDSLKNITAAQTEGIHGIHFQSPEQLEGALKELEITV